MIDRTFWFLLGALTTAIVVFLAAPESRGAGTKSLSRADLKLQSMVWSPIGIRARWCRRQGECGD